MKKAIRFSVCVCLVSWLAYGIFHFVSGGDPKSNRILFTLFTTFYMLLPMLVAMLLQRIDREKFTSTGLLNFKFSWAWLWAPVIPIAVTALSILVSALFPGVSLHYGAEQMISQFSLDDATARTAIAQLEAFPPAVFIAMEIVSGIIAGCTINAVFAFGEEYGWRNYLNAALKGCGFWKKALFIGLVWGIWHMPLILQGHNYPQHPVLGVAMMCVVCVLLGTLELYLVEKTGSVIPAAVMHGTFNAVSGIALMLVLGGNDLLIGATGLAGFISMGLVILAVWLYDRRHDGIMSTKMSA